MGIIRLYLETKNDYHIHRLKNTVNALDRNKKFVVTIKEDKPVRTLDQNKYLWGVVYKIIAQENGSTMDKVHIDLKEMFGYKEERASIVTGEIRIVEKSTKEYNTLEMATYIDKIKNWAIDFLGITIPEPNSEVALHVYENQL